MSETIIGEPDKIPKTRNDLLRSLEYWIATTQIHLYNVVDSYVSAHKLSARGLAQHAEVKKRHVKQALRADFNQSLETLVKLSMACGMVPIVEFKSIDKVIEEDEKDRIRKT